MPYSRQAARLPRPSTRTRRRISDHFSMFVNTLVPHSSGPRWSAGRPPSWARSGGSDQGCDTFRPPVGYPARCCPFSPPFRFCGWILEIIKRNDDVKGFQLLPKRWVVERTFSWLSNYRRLSKHYEYWNETGEAMIYVAMIHVMLRRLGRKESGDGVI